MRIRFFSNKRLKTRRVAGYHDLRLDGISDILFRARGTSVLDIGCNRGLVSFELANNGAALIHGCDVYDPGLNAAREIFADMPQVEFQFEHVDLTGGGEALKKGFGSAYRDKYDIVLLLAVYQKLKRIMKQSDLDALVHHLAERTGRYFCWRGAANEVPEIEPVLLRAGLKRMQYSDIASYKSIGPAAIWATEKAFNSF